MSGTKEYLVQLGSFNLWANAQYAAYFSKLSSEVLTAPLAGSFPSLAKTLIHIWDAQEIWLRRLSGESPTGFPSTINPPTLLAIWPGLEGTSAQLLEYIHGTLIDPEETMHYHTVAGVARSSLYGDVLTHIFFHSMYHRGQCVTMARTLGLEPVPSTDYIRFTWEN